MLVKTRVLVVEDEAIVSMLLEVFLEDLGCEVVASASRLDEALVKASSLTFDVATLDVNLAGTLSYPAALVLQKRSIPFIFTTGYQLTELPSELQDVPVLSKPFTQEQLAVALQTVVPH